ncbi:MAG: hypothetical protein AAGH88_09080 [Planctomycetota bacterium]
MNFPPSDAVFAPDAVVVGCGGERPGFDVLVCGDRHQLLRDAAPEVDASVLHHPASASIYAACIDPVTGRVITGGRDGQVAWWEWSPTRERYRCTFRHHVTGAVLDLCAVSPSVVAVTDDTGSLVLIDRSDPIQVCVIPCDTGEAMMVALCWLESGRLAGLGIGGDLRVWEPDRPDRFRMMPAPPPPPQGAWVRLVPLDSTCVAYLDREGHLVAVDTERGIADILPAHPRNTRNTGNLTASGTAIGQQPAGMAAPEFHAARHTPTPEHAGGHAYAITAVAGGVLTAGASNRRIIRWAWRDRHLTPTSEEACPHHVVSIAPWDPDGKRVCVVFADGRSAVLPQAEDESLDPASTPDNPACRVVFAAAPADRARADRRRRFAAASHLAREAHAALAKGDDPRLDEACRELRSRGFVAASLALAADRARRASDPAREAGLLHALKGRLGRDHALSQRTERRLASLWREHCLDLPLIEDHPRNHCRNRLGNGPPDQSLDIIRAPDDLSRSAAVAHASERALVGRWVLRHGEPTLFPHHELTPCRIAESLGGSDVAAISVSCRAQVRDVTWVYPGRVDPRNTLVISPAEVDEQPLLEFALWATTTTEGVRINRAVLARLPERTDQRAAQADAQVIAWIEDTQHRLAEHPWLRVVSHELKDALSRLLTEVQAEDFTKQGVCHAAT